MSINKNLVLCFTIILLVIPSVVVAYTEEEYLDIIFDIALPYFNRENTISMDNITELVGSDNRPLVLNYIAENGNLIDTQNISREHFKQIIRYVCASKKKIEEDEKLDEIYEAALESFQVGPGRGLTLVELLTTVGFENALHVYQYMANNNVSLEEINNISKDLFNGIMRYVTENATG